jgi:hypothetical protein
MTVRRITRWAAISLASISVGLAGVAAAAGNSGSVNPGKGCGDRNHVHYKQDECKKPHDARGGDRHKDHHQPQHHDQRR